MNVLLVGCGHMGSAMLAGWLANPAVTRVDVIEPSGGVHPDARVHMHKNASAVAGKNFDMVVLAVKPQVMQEVCVGLASSIDAAAPVMSIAAGVPLAMLAKNFGSNRALVRAMPNTPGAIGQGITGFVTNQKASQKQLDAVNLLLSSLGLVVEVAEESQMDAVTALSGSGPAYIFALTESMEKAGIASGLPAEIAAKLARQTVIGAAALMAQSPESPENLRRAVTSPGGTTEAALDVLGENRRLEKLVNEAISAAAQKSRDLAQGQ